MPPTDALPLAGVCLRGEVRDAIDAGGVFDAGYCHRSTCRRATGAPVLAWVNIVPAAFHIMHGEPAAYSSSSRGERVFCGRCGTPPLYRPADAAAHVSVQTATLDDPHQASAAPRVHLPNGRQLGWLALADDLSRHPTNRLPHPDRR